tara:strand:+ start:430 stop:636 length:207 start_codon:yes stop_codon:yes gene_type:complete
MSVLKLEIKPGESIEIGDNVTLTLEEKSGQTARLSFDAPREVSIRRKAEATPVSIAAQGGLKGLYNKP